MWSPSFHGHTGMKGAGVWLPVDELTDLSPGSVHLSNRFKCASKTWGDILLYYRAPNQAKIWSSNPNA